MRLEQCHPRVAGVVKAPAISQLDECHCMELKNLLPLQIRQTGKVESTKGLQFVRLEQLSTTPIFLHESIPL